VEWKEACMTLFVEIKGRKMFEDFQMEAGCRWDVGRN
jgi:hypothetical protein